MSDFPESKQKRLMSLNQDVLAVSPAAAKKAEPVARKQGTGARQAIQSPAAAAKQRQGGPVLMILAVLACAGIIAGVLGTMLALDSKQQLATLKAGMQKPDAQVSSLAARVAELEGRLDAAGQETDKMDDQSQSSLLQINSRIRKTALDLSRLSSDLSKVQSSINSSDASMTKLRADLGKQNTQLMALQSQVNALQSRVSSAGGKSSAPAVDTSEFEAQVLKLNVQMEKQANEIKAIYRMLEAR